MTKTLFIIIFICIFCTSCGVKGDPEYKSQSEYNKKIYII